MYTGRTVFSQLIDFMPLRDFGRCVRRYRGEGCSAPSPAAGITGKVDLLLFFALGRCPLFSTEIMDDNRDFHSRRPLL